VGVGALPAYLIECGVDAECWTSAFARALAPDPVDRYACAGDFKRALLLALGVSETDARLAWALSGGTQQAETDSETAHGRAAEQIVSAMFADTRPVQDVTMLSSLPQPETTVETMLAMLPVAEGEADADITRAHDNQETVLGPRPGGGGQKP
jgi:hypothetical protein